MLWVKLKKECFGTVNDLYISTCYIPPEESNVYRNPRSSLFELDLFEKLSQDVMRFSSLGDVFLDGDFNARVGLRPDYVENFNLDRYVHMPFVDHESISGMSTRQSRDSTVNAFGKRLLSLCKENELLFIVNGRLEPGNYTCFNTLRNTSSSGVVDYLITSHETFRDITHMDIFELTEFSDHCPIEFGLNCEYSVLYHTDFLSYDKIVWDNCNPIRLEHTLNDKKYMFDELLRRLESGNIDTDTYVDDLSNIIYEISFQLHGRTCRVVPSNSKLKNSQWFNIFCKESNKSFIFSKRDFRSNPTEQNRQNFLQKRRIYCKAKLTAKNHYFNNERRKISQLHKTSPRKFWKHVNKFMKNDANCRDGLSLEEFVNNFKNISNTPSIDSSTEPFNFDPDVIFIEEFDKPFTLEEISKTISLLHRHKSADFDKNVADFIIDSNVFITTYLVSISNKIFDSGKYPEKWCKGVIIPLHKKGNLLNTANCRGITVINVMAKIFSLALRNRLNNWCESEHVFNESHFGFRNNRSTTDCVYLLHSIIRNILYKHFKLYCAFIDYQMAFDTVIRDALWSKSMRLGISCKMLDMFKAIYHSVKSCVKISPYTDFSEMFDVTIRLKQGEPLSFHSIYT